MSTIILNGIAIAYDDHGRSANAIVLVHGHPFNRTMWAPQIDPLVEAGWRVIVPDLRGYGETEVAPGVTTLDVFARDIEALLDHLNAEQVTIVGLSMGGQIAMECARLFPERLRGMVLTATFPQAETEAGKQVRCAMAARLRRHGMDGYAAEALPMMLSPRSIAALPDVAARVTAMMRATDPEGAAAALLGRAQRPPYEPVLAALRIPGLVIVGDEDYFTTREDVDRMHGLLRGSELVSLRGVGHMPNLECPHSFNAALLSFLARTASSTLSAV